MLPYADAFVDENPFCSQVMGGIMAEAVHRHYNLMLYTAPTEISAANAATQIDPRIDGLIVVLPPSDSPVFGRCEKRNIPFISVLIDPQPGFWTVNSDDYQGGRLAAEYLIGLGHQRIAHLRGAIDINTSAPRERGFRDALERAGIEIDPRLIIQAGFDWKVGYQAMAKLLNLPQGQRPTAVFAANDLCAEGAMRAIRENELRIPEDISIVGFDDTRFASMTQPPLTTVHMPIAEMGATAARMLIDRIEGRDVADPNPFLPVSFTVRHSCGPVAAAHSLGSTKIPLSIQ
jgi:LacI family transcriptional regulator